VAAIVLLQNNQGYLTGTIIYRAVEFGCGIIAARMFINNTFHLTKRPLWLLLFIIITYVGRILVSKVILSLSISYYGYFTWQVTH
jgi:hypothetical protein